MQTVTLSDYDLIIVNSSAGKDSLCAIWEICRLATEQQYDFSKIKVSHQDLGKMEWKDTKELAAKQAELFGLDIFLSKRRNSSGYEETLLEYARRRKMWPSNNQRWCTSDYKRAPGARVVVSLTANMPTSKVLHVFGFRAAESPFRKKKEALALNKNLTTKKREVWDFLPIHEWSTAEVWQVIRSNNLPYHYAYDLGMPRLSCVFCIFSPLDALVIAGRNNTALLSAYVAVEKEIGHTFKADLSLAEVQQKIKEGYQVDKIDDWVM